MNFPTKDSAIQKILQLVERFHEQKESYHRADYNETLTRRDFIDPFFKALGWDVDNEHGFAESYREVIHEDRVKVGGATKAPDYSFRLSGGKRLFFVEAKKPSVLIKDDITPAYQVRRYGWSAKLPISIITDFEEFAIYDCTKKPNPTDKASNGRLKYLTYSNYLNEFDFIWDTFSKERVLKGSFDKFIQSDKHKKGTTTVDHEFLQSLDTWRTFLANNIALRNNIDEDELNFIVQHIIDRIIFLRIAEDRSVENYGNLKDTLKGDDYYQNLLRQFHTADQKYNSGLFDFKKDKISDSIAIDNKVIKSIINDLYYPLSPYEFSVLSVEILGSAYEQFLGKTITLSKTGKALIEEKPEVRKAGGVYYTPEYIVEYIVNNTVGKLTEGKTPKEISKLKIVDPACGSGSFLIGAYQFLLNWHKDYYSNNGKPSKGSKDNPLTPDGNLTTAEKKRILLNNIYGVDLDANAVEVTKLSLLLKCMEGETEASIATQLRLFHERILPTLDDNIKCGNSLIDVDFYNTELDFGEERKIKPFSWKKAFSEVFKQGGFDCVIGNPPYIRVQFLNSSKESLNYFANNYKTAAVGNYDIYVLFIEKALKILNEKGMSGYILPHKFFNSKYGVPTREILSKGQNLTEIVHFGDKQVFTGATTYTCLLFLSNKKSKEFTFSEVNNLVEWKNNLTSKKGSIDAKRITDKEWNLSTGNEQELFSKLEALPLKLGEISKIFVGLQTSADTVFLFKDTLKTNKKVISVYSKELDEEVQIETELLKEVVRSGQIGKHWINPNALVLFPYHIKDGQPTLMSEKELKTQYPLAWYYLLKNKALLENRENGKFKASGWYQLYPKNLEMWDEPKIMLPYMIKELAAYYDEKSYYFVNVTTGGFGLRIIKENINPLFITGLLNSKVLDWYLKKVSTNFNSGYFAANKQFLVQLPIELGNKQIMSDIVKLVEQLHKLNRDKQESNLTSKTDQLQNRIDYAEQRINEIVYELYKLTKEEIDLIEKGS
ncbi:Eco57I restriction-modification methylase domain-containing protein [Lacibacter sp.]|uniref:Eco57I restriction-modification methylase domain-containing protein n=1 Tax=Lacibacter sp. TaxID=1915409 RepID=UPI002B4ABAF4|nr:N-6 DNA methylase [Lacibacter sp.]HLP36577.1 N-6 DNA methylase [Lacibacter sp.]